MGESILAEAERLVGTDRNTDYGPPAEDGVRAAGVMNALGYRGPGGRELSAHDWAIFMVAVKLSRLMVTPGKRDSWVDMAGYAQCGWESVGMVAQVSAALDELVGQVEAAHKATDRSEQSFKAGCHKIPPG